jgi:hypothetical protein
MKNRRQISNKITGVHTMRKRNFLNTVCPFSVLEKRVTWGEFIKLQIQAIIGVVFFFAYYFMAIILADIIEVAG